jgi:hypothetical protein
MSLISRREAIHEAICVLKAEATPENFHHYINAIHKLEHRYRELTDELNKVDQRFKDPYDYNGYQ